MIGSWLIILAIFLSGPGRAVAATTFGDEFHGPPLGTQWRQENVTIGFSGDWVTLTGANDALGRIILRADSLSLKWPWAFETRIDCPDVNPTATPFKGGMGLYCAYGDGTGDWLELGRLAGPGKNVVYAIGGTYLEYGAQDPALGQADKLYLRIEGAGSDQRTIHLGIRGNPMEPWVWVLEQALPKSVVTADTFQLLKHDASHGGIFHPTGTQVIFGFDYAYFEGESFVKLTPWAPPMDPTLPIRAAAMHPLDLETRAELAVNAMIGAIDPITRYPIIFATLSPSVSLQGPVGVLGGEFVDGLTMARLLSGFQRGVSTEQVMRQSIYEQIVGGLGDSGGGPVIEVAGHKHLLPSLMTLHRLDPDDPRPLQLMRESMNKFYSIALSGTLSDGRPYVYYPVPDSVAGPGDYSYINYHRTEGWQGRTREPIDTGSACFEGVITLPFAQYYDLTRDPVAREYLDKFIRFLLERSTDYNPDGSFTRHDVTSGQVWSRMMTMEGILLYGLAAGRQDLVDWAWRAYGRNLQLHGTRFGWLPENLAFNHGLGCESDTMTAQLEIAFILARLLDDFYWEVAERIAMNQLLAQQLWRVDLLGNYSPLLGGFASFCSPNDWWTPEGPYITQSSHGSGMRALYNVWYHAAWWERGEQAEDALRINLHWSKNLPGARIISHLPSATRLEIEVERPCSLIVRKPDWAQIGSIQAQAAPSSGGTTTTVPITLRGRWMHLGSFSANTRITLHFPDEVVTYQDTIRRPQGNVTFTTKWRGNAVIEIQPRGVKQPNYDGRLNRPPYIPVYTATQALDPIFMNPLENTGEPHRERFGENHVAKPPNSPENLSATAATSQVTLRWTAPAPVQGVAVTGYNVFRTVPGPVELLTLTPVAGTQFFAPNLLEGRQYCFFVRSVGDNGIESRNSGEACATTPGAEIRSLSTEFDGVAGPWSAADSARTALAARPGWLRVTTPPGTFGTIVIAGGLPVDRYPPEWHFEMSLERPTNVSTAIGILTQSDGIQYLFNNLPGRIGPGGATAFGAGALWNASGKGVFGQPDFSGVPESEMAGDAIEIWVGVTSSTTMRYGVRRAGSPVWKFAPEVVGGFDLSAAPVSFSSFKIMVENRQPWFDQWLGTKASLENVVVDIDYIRFIEGPPRPMFRRGDVDPNQAWDTSDAIDILYYKFLGQFDPTCLEALDADDSGEIDQTDAIRILYYAFLGGEPLPEPFMTCGADTTPDKEGTGTPPDLGCESYPACPQ